MAESTWRMRTERTDIAQSVRSVRPLTDQGLSQTCNLCSSRTTTLSSRKEGAQPLWPPTVKPLADPLATKSELVALREEIQAIFGEIQTTLEALRQKHDRNNEVLLRQEVAMKRLLDAFSQKEVSAANAESKGVENDASNAINETAAVPGGFSETRCSSRCSITSGRKTRFTSWATRSTQDLEGSRRPSTSPGKNMFGNLTVGKETYTKMDYDVSMYYYDDGVCQWVARNDRFQNFTLFVFLVNAVYIGIDADYNRSDNLLDSKTHFFLAENFFCTFFFVEWFIRFFSFRETRFCLKDMWFKFDSVLVLCMVCETWVVPYLVSGQGAGPLSLLKMLRLLRLARMARLMRAFPELCAMIKGVKVASRAVGSALAMLVALLYVTSIIMYMLLRDGNYAYPKDPDRFGRLSSTMLALIIDGVFLDSIGTLTISLLDQDKWEAALVLLFFVLASALTVMNMLIGVLCEVVSEVASAEKEENEIKMIKDTLLVMLRELDEDDSGNLSVGEVAKVMEDPASVSVLSRLEVDIDYLLEQLELAFQSQNEVRLEDVINLIVILRGTRHLTVTDLVISQNIVKAQLERLENHTLELLQGLYGGMIPKHRVKYSYVLS